MAAHASTQPAEYRDSNGKPHILFREAVRRFGWGLPTLRAWTSERKCVWIGRRVHTIPVDAPDAAGRCWRQLALSVEDLEAIRRAQAAPVKTACDVRRREAMRILGEGGAALRSVIANGQDALGGRPVDTERRPVQRPDGQTRNVVFFSSADLKAVRRARGAGTDQRGVTAEQATAELGVSESLIHWWRRHGCYYLPGRRCLETVGTFARRVGRPVRLYSRTEVQAIAEARRAEPDGIFPDRTGRYLTAKAAEQTFPHLRALKLDYWYREDRCPYVKGSFRRWAKEVRLPGLRAPRPKVRVYREEILAKVDAELARRAGDADALRELLLAGPVPVREVRARMSARGVSRDRLWNLQRQLGVRCRQAAGFGSTWNCELPGVAKRRQQPPPPVAPAVDKPRPADPTYDRGQWLYDEWEKRPAKKLQAIRIDLNRIADARGWERLADDTAVYMAVKRWCQKHGHVMTPRKPRGNA